MTRSLRSLGLAALCALWAAPAGARSPCSATTARRVGAEYHRKSKPRPRPHPKRLARRRRRSSATLGCGSCRRRGASDTVSGRSAATGAARITFRASPTSAISPARSASGFRDRAELFGSFLVDTRIDRDLRPLFINDPDFGGIVDRYPRVNQRWTGDNVGDFYLGAKYQLVVRVPPEAGGARRSRHGEAADRHEDAGVGTGRPISASTSSRARKIRRKVELSGIVGYEFRGKPDGFDIPGGAFRWGVGAGFPSRSPYALTLELSRIAPTGDTATIPPARWSARTARCRRLSRHREHHARDGRAYVAGIERGSSSARDQPGTSR